MSYFNAMRGFPEAEYADRVARAQAAMANHGLAALLLTTEREFRYFTGFLTRFWESPTRPWFLIVPASGKPVAVVPSIGAPLLERGWLEDIRTWRSPDLNDDGVELLADTLNELSADGRIGLPMGHETHLRMPLADFFRLHSVMGPNRLSDDRGIMRELRMVKSVAEIEKIRAACSVADRAFARVGEIAAPGKQLDEVFRRFQILCLEEGADWVPYLAGGAGPQGYDDVISPATQAPLAAGDVLMLDTGLVRDGYFCDFDRNFAISSASDEMRDAHGKLIEATAAAFDMAKPGALACDLFHGMDSILTGGKGGAEAGRYGHGLGMSLTEWPSLIADDRTELVDGMVLTLEPGIETAPGRMLVHEENIVIGAGGAQYLSAPASAELPILNGAAGGEPA
ncbi:MAG: aminopeptidase P family protein [Nitratireductor sp.]|nr:aminopeptidase P family protein [Nitratireductor sp.]